MRDPCDSWRILISVLRLYPSDRDKNLDKTLVSNVY